MESNFYIGVLTVLIHLPFARSLKDRRQVLRSIKDHFSKKYRVSVTEFGNPEKWQVIRLGFTFGTSSFTGGEERLAAMEKELELRYEHMRVEDKEVIPWGD